VKSRVVLAAAAAAIAVAAGGVAVWNSSWLRLGVVQVVGNHHVQASQVVGAAALSPGVRLSAVSSPLVAARVEALPWVASATVTHVLPSRIRIAVRERTPAAVVQAGSRGYLVDGQGVILEEGGSGYPVVAGLPLAAAVPGDRITPPAFRAALKVLESLPPAVRGRLAAVNAQSPDLVSLALTDRTSIVYGGAESLGDKNDAVRALLAGGRTYTSIDVRAPTRPAAHPR